MTLSPKLIGDRGQRYELHATGWPKAGDNVIGWSDFKWKLADKGHALLTTNPAVTAAFILDRKTSEITDIEP